ncbi:MAG: hypothetical protein IJQ39_12195 [Thermoguttaceae bacterium]|nr:hypothetical protein [Thermoguttaceae bacterium]
MSDIKGCEKPNQQICGQEPFPFLERNKKAAQLFKEILIISFLCAIVFSEYRQS